MYRFPLLLGVVVFLAITSGCGMLGSRSWRDEFAERLPVLGHRNIIVVADAAYPAQASPGITTIWTGQKLLETAKEVLDAIEAAPHVNPIVWLDSELESVPESDSPGVTEFRAALGELLEGREVRPLDHMKIIAKLDETGKTFDVLILKTDLTIPYTSVFIELDCGYWGPEEEARMRASSAGEE